MIVLLQTFRLGMDNRLAFTLRKKRAQGRNAVKDAPDGKRMKAVLGNEAKGLEVYHK